MLLRDKHTSSSEFAKLLFENIGLLKWVSSQEL
ncbi:hypothetical protein C8D97_105216 [Pleionea mediterranea]|jgi:hypothetical protein|uniref:Uncharacterized protein n=1 Tax=Pleionea mediterranea TaxID=523701 RepID=A0A316FWC2_9GAMM|nr:hypothetical protein C8D97_105216 [Pleionea mediterranea]